MGRKSWSVESLNNFVMDNLKPYSWSHFWEQTLPDRDGMFYFNMCARPNTYARTNNFYRAGVLWEHIPASCALELPTAEFYSSYIITIPMLTGTSLFNGKELDQHPKRKYNYRLHLEYQAMKAIELLDLDRDPMITNSKEVFGTPKQEHSTMNGWERIKAYSAGAPRTEWSFV